MPALLAVPPVGCLIKQPRPNTIRSLRGIWARPSRPCSRKGETANAIQISIAPAPGRLASGDHGDAGRTRGRSSRASHHTCGRDGARGPDAHRATHARARRYARSRSIRQREEPRCLECSRCAGEQNAETTERERAASRGCVRRRRPALHGSDRLQRRRRNVRRP